MAINSQIIINKNDIKILKHIYRNRNNVTRGKLLKKFKKLPITDRLSNLESASYITHDHFYARKPDGFRVPLSDDTSYTLTDLGISEVEKHQWFNWQFFLLQIVLPIVIAIISTLITIFLSALL